jgi:FecR protein
MYKTRFAPAVLTAVACALLALPALAASQARIVRLSDVHGSVQMDKNTGLGFERAFLNLPITQGVQLQTSASGRAEIEFEDGSTLRLAPDSKVEFSTLGLSDSGQRISVVNLIEGMAYVNWMSKSDAFTLNFSSEKVELNHPAHVRAETTPTLSKFAVFKGDVEVTSPSGKVMVSKKKMATFDSSADDKYTLAKFEEAPLDSWDKEAADYHQQYAKTDSSPYGYGFSDLNYYGAYQNIAGYGLMWQPYFTGIGWDPFMDGAWSFYPGFGFMYASAYPWGWLPYRYGNWMFVPGFGWMWQPGYWNSWVGVPRYTGTLPAGFHPLAAPTGTVQTVVVGKGGPVVGTTLASRLVVTKGSAGLGIARGSMGDLAHLNTQVAKSGSAEVHPSSQFGAVRSSGGAYSASHSGMSSAGAGHSAGASSGASHSSSGASGGHHN